MSDSESIPPVVFISYSWTSPDHTARVLSLASELRSVWNLEVRLDQWHLAPGGDAFHFMEQEIVHADKVLIVSDCEYVRKANAREKGVGAEAQILTPKLYAQGGGDGQKAKYAVVTTELGPDGSACVPTFYGGRIFIDLTDPARHFAAAEEIARWAHDKPLNVPPPVGGSPPFLNSGPSSPTYGPATAARAALASGGGNAVRLAEDYMASMTRALAALVPADGPGDAGDALLAAARSLAPLYLEAEAVLVELARARLGAAGHRVLRRLFTGLFPYVFDYEPLADESVPASWQRDVFRYVVPDLFRAAVAALLVEDDSQGVVELTAIPYAPALSTQRRSSDAAGLFTRLQPGIDTRTLRDDVEAVRQDRGDALPLEVQGQADLVLFLASVSQTAGSLSTPRDLWYPEVLLANGMYYRDVALPAFREAESQTRLARLAAALSTDGDGLKGMVEQVIEAEEQGVRGIPSLSYRRLTGLARLGSRP